MHPIERLRMVARAAGEGPALLAQEAAGALAAFADDPPGLVTACRRLVGRQPTSGPMWWLAARVLTAGEPGGEAWRAANELEMDPTPQVLAECLPDDGTVCVVGWPELVAGALTRRGDIAVYVVDLMGEGGGLVRRLTSRGCDAELVPEYGAGQAAANSDVIVVEASALGPDAFVAAAGSLATAAVGRHAGADVWVVAGRGRVLPGAMWRALADRVQANEDWDTLEELVPLDLATSVARPDGLLDPTEAARRPDCGVAPELLRETG